MLKPLEEKSLKSYNTFGLDVHARQLLALTDPEQLADIPNRQEALILGGGSNVLFTGDVTQTVILNQTRGISVEDLDETHVLIEVASGENWHELVRYCVARGYGGIENLSLIPGSVGAAPMQNIGAYGVEIKDVLSYVDAIHLETLSRTRFDPMACKFGYRESVFKRALKGQYFIAQIGLILRKRDHQINASYGAIQAVLDERKIASPAIADISDAVIAIRQSKLPDPKLLGNAGSFFKNPVIPKSHFEQLQKAHPTMKCYPIDDQQVKVPAGWLIESMGWKGKRVGNTGSHAQQALVLVNYGRAKGSEIKALSEQIKASVWNTYQIHLETEVNIY